MTGLRSSGGISAYLEQVFHICRVWWYGFGMDFVHPISAVIPGVQGRVLEVLAATTAELNLRSLARLSGVSVAQASRVLPGLVDLGLVERREVPPSSQFLFVRSHVAAGPILALANARESVFVEFGRIAKSLPLRPVSVIVFGSLARGEADLGSDIDVVLVRPPGVGDDDEVWGVAVERWRVAVHRLTGNAVEVLEVAASDVASRLASRSQVWRDIRRDGRVVFGVQFDELAGVRVG